MGAASSLKIIPTACVTTARRAHRPDLRISDQMVPVVRVNECEREVTNR
jgi:hypothetical protein